MSYFNDVERDLVVAGRTVLADRVVALELVSPNGRDLPSWTPGSHLDVILSGLDGTGTIERQYSLCGDAEDRSTWRIAVLREEDGRGGSLRMHDDVRVGQRLRVRGPRNHFTLDVTPGTAYRFVAGGIGITPIRGMLAAADAAGADWRLDYAGRSVAAMAFAAELAAAHPDRVRIHAADECARLDVGALAAEVDERTAVFVCGPTRLIEALETSIDARFERALHVEHFEAKEFGDPVWPAPFDVELALTGALVHVSPTQSVLEAIEEQSPETIALASCRRGTCGTCEVTVLEGEVEHRDSVLTPFEQADDTVMMVCVSRAACPRLVLDL